MTRRHLALLLALLTTPALACLWDRDTLAMEREQFPTVLEIITGKFLHHSEAFYRWRVEDRRKKLAATPDDLALRDDLAVALEKSGRTPEGIEVLRGSLAKDPQRYETLANLGTLLIHDGKLEEGLGFIRRAITVNPDAHFGREVYQQKLVEYVMSQRAAGATLPLRKVPGVKDSERSFFWFLGTEKRLGDTPYRDTRDVDLAKAAQGVLGMLVFGNNDSPVLHEALGDLLWSQGHLRLATRAYLRAASVVEDDAAREAYQDLARQAIAMQTGVGYEAVLQSFRAELAEAQAWRAQLAADEAGWVASGQDPEAAYAARYHAAPRVEASDGWLGMVPGGGWSLGLLALVLLGGARRLLVRLGRQ